MATYLAARSAKSVVFTSQRSVGCLRQAFFLLLADGQWERVEFIADRLATVRKHESGPFEPIRDMINGARWYAVRAGLRSVIERLTPAAFDPPGYKPLFLSGESLMRPLDDPATRANVGLDTNEPFDILPVSERPGPFLMDLSKMSTMWAYGGSAEWPVERLEAERVRLEAAMKELPGMH
ncbi:hypothetical protein AX769_06255 [Frondihabitans sp. PAMC 28766]|nr:hypothetical protein AX769_06255 [Frondihabitans sp. PAMC 28766]